MKTRYGAAVCLAIAATLAFNVGSVFADVIFLGPAPQVTGVGRLAPALALQAPRGSGTESGGVRWTGTSDEVFGDALRGLTQTRTLAESGAISAADLRIFLSINEPDGAITLNSLTLTAYNESGTAVFSGSYTGPPLTLQSLPSGGSRSPDYVFGLDSSQAVALQAQLALDPNLRLGVQATLTSAGGGFDSFALGSALP
jgi:hypothetical protein